MKEKIFNCENIKNELIKEIKKTKNLKNLTLSCIYIENDMPSISFFRQIEKLGKKLHIQIQTIVVNNKEKIIKNKITSLNQDTKVNGILLLKPQDKNFDYEKLNNLIIKNKNIDPIDCPVIVHAVIKVLNKIENSKNKNIVILGRGPLVGKPLYQYLKNKNYMVTVCHSKTKEIKAITKEADIVISAVGKANFVDHHFIKKNAIVIDIGTNYNNGKICGDVDFNDVIDQVCLITKVPGGISLLTTTMLFKQFIDLNKKTE